MSENQDPHADELNAVDNQLAELEDQKDQLKQKLVETARREEEENREPLILGNGREAFNRKESWHSYVKKNYEQSHRDFIKELREGTAENWSFESIVEGYFGERGDVVMNINLDGAELSEEERQGSIQRILTETGLTKEESIPLIEKARLKEKSTEQKQESSLAESASGAVDTVVNS